MVGHDLREPLRSISNYARLLLETEGASLSPKGRRWLEDFVLAPSIRVSTLAVELQTYVDTIIHADPESSRTIDVNQLANSAIEMLNGRVSELGAAITLNRLPQSATGTVALRSVLYNLLSNSLKYHHPDRSPQVQVWAYRHKSKPMWVMGVTDNGLGFEPEFAEEIFKLGKRLHGSKSVYWGSGVGLAVVRHHVESWGGTIAAESKPGIGSTFSFTIPL